MLRVILLVAPRCRAAEGIERMPKPAVLVVDDDPMIAATVAEVLRAEGYPTTTAENGLAALTFFERDQPRLVLLDMQMPVLDGWGFARVLQDRRRELKLVVMTAAADAARCAEQIHADGYLAKPFDLEHLLAEVTRPGAA
jgi:two-component system, chemotaxis family, chemotaxis protein CheY